MNSQPKPSRQEVVVMLLDGVARVGRGAKNLSEEQWTHECCGRWTSSEVARHLLASARAHQHWLDSAISGDTTIPYAIGETDAENHSAVEFLADLSGPEAVAEFVRTAGRYANRVADHWDTEMGVPGGVVTAGQHCSLAALEFHLHAWDLAQMNNDTRYEPPRVRQLLSATAEARAVQVAGVDALKIVTISWVRHRYQAWRYLLKASGRTPSRHSRLSASSERLQESLEKLRPSANPLSRQRSRTGTEADHGSTEPEQVIDLRGDTELPLAVTDRTSVTSD